MPASTVDDVVNELNTLVDNNWVYFKLFGGIVGVVLDNEEGHRTFVADFTANAKSPRIEEKAIPSNATILVDTSDTAFIDLYNRDEEPLALVCSGALKIESS